MKLHKSVLLGLIFGAIAALAAHAQNFSEEFHQTYPLSPDGRVELRNINGKVKITSWDRNEVKVDALKYAGTRERLAEAKIEVDASPSSVSIKTHYQDHDLTFSSDDPINNPASVDYTLTVPAGARLDAIKLVNGDLDLENISGDVTASCINGRLHAAALSGRTELSTVNGELDFQQGVIPSEGASPSRGTPTQPGTTESRAPSDVSLKSVNGTVVITLPSDANAEVTAKTVHGDIRNDFGLPVNDGRYVGHSLAGRLGAGAARIELKNVNGSISVHHASDGKPLSPATNLLPSRRAEMD